MTAACTRGWRAIILGLALAPALAFAQNTGSKEEFQPEVGQAGKDVIWVPTPEFLVERMLQMAQVGPNDLVVEGRKLGGLLVEGGGEHAGPVRAVAGLGLNVRMPRDAAQGIDQPWTDLATIAPATAASRNALAATVLSWLLPALEQFDRDGLAPFRERYAAFDALRDREVAVIGAGDALQGVALGLADDGGLRIRLSNGETRTMHAGEVSVRAA